MNPEFLRRVRLFEDLEVSELADLLMLGLVKEYAQEEVVFEEGSPGESFFVIYDGAVRISKMFHNVGEEALTVLGAGEFFGEMSFVDGTPTSARVVAEEPTRLRVIDTTTVDNLSKADPAFAGRLYRSIAAILAERLRLASMRTYADQSWG